MDFGSAFTFVTKDEDWIKKMVIAAVLVLTGIGIIPVLGWSVAITRRTITGETDGLPEWSDFGALVVDGLKYIGVAFIWMLPYLIVAACFSVIAAMAAGQMASRYDADTTTLIINLCLSLISLPYIIIFTILLPALQGQVATADSFGEMVNPAAAFKLVRANPGGYLLAWLVGGLAMSVLSFVGTLVCLVGFYPAAAYGYAITGNLAGQAYREAENRGALAAA